ncbi:MAG: TolC family outer membrane protein [Gammaproteobacteria bacterium]|nr:TolC family outer membrane protein [Gammaproteobacteria bacterium]
MPTSSSHTTPCNRLANLGLGLTLCLIASSAHSESLMAIHSLAVGNDPQYKAAEAGLAAAQEALPQSRANFLPSLRASASHTEDFDSSIDAYNSYSLALRQPIYEHGSFVQRRSAKSAVAQAEAVFRGAEQALIVDVASAYFNVLSAQDNLQFAEAEKRSNARQLDQTQQRFDVGLVAITDVHESRAAYDISVAQAIEAQNLLDAAGESLREITGRYHDSLDTLSEDMPLVPPTPIDLQDWTELALTQNPDLLAAMQATEQAEENVNAQRSDHYPTVDLSLVHSDTDSDRFIAGTDTDSTTATLSLNLALYSGGRTQSSITQAREFLKQSRQALEQARRSTQRTVRNAYRGVISGISRVKALKQALVSSQSALRAAEAGYEVGTRTTVDVLVARRNLFSAQRDYSQSRYNYLLDTLRLQQAAGSLTTQNLKTVSDWLR